MLSNTSNNNAYMYINNTSTSKRIQLNNESHVLRSGIAFELRRTFQTNNLHHGIAELARVVEKFL